MSASIGDNIKHLRTQVLALTRAELAAAIDVHPQTVYGWESGRYTPRPGHLRALARLAEVEVRAITLGQPAQRVELLETPAR
jgi:DNA-binding XRE family transcriptional regulator